MYCSRTLRITLSLLIGASLASKEDINRSFEEIVSARGYAVEQHYVTTVDGYINCMYRIPGRVGNDNSTVRGPPVMLMHGIIDSSDAWVVNND